MKVSMRKQVASILFATLVMMVFTSNAYAVSDQPFVDVKASDYYAEAVQWAVEAGVTSGTSNNTFSPNDACTRAQAVTFIWRAYGQPEPTNSKINAFSDVPANAYYSKAVQWAVEKQITSGIGNNKFNPDGICNRAQIVTFLYRAAGSPEVGQINAFSDVPANAYYSKAVQWAVSNGVTSGTGNNQFSPDSNCTRGQIVTFLYRNMGKGTTDTSKQPEPPVPAAKGMNAYGLNPNAQMNVAYPYKTCCSTNHSKQTSGTATITSYTRTDAGNGYETINVDFDMVFADENAWRYGMQPVVAIADYYMYEDGGEHADLRDGNHDVAYSVVWNGQTYDQCYTSPTARLNSHWEGQVGYITYRFTAVVPSGYDGIVVWVACRPNVEDSSYYCKHLGELENLIMFRCN